MVKALAFKTIPFEKILKGTDIKFFEFNMNRCDERTFYISISLSTQRDRTICDLIYLLDKHDLYGAISLNDKYDHARNFFKKNFGYNLLYSDEQTIAKMISVSSKFKHCLKQYANVYPKYVQAKFFN